MNEDTRNVTDELKGLSESQISSILDQRGVETEVAIENTIRDFNMGSIVRSANAFGVRTVHVVGRKQWNKRGAMMTYKYLRIIHHESFELLKEYALQHRFKLIAVDNVTGASSIVSAQKARRSILLFGQEGPGLGEDALKVCDEVLMIEQRGSTRSLNVGVAAGIAIHEWVRDLTE